MNNPQRSSQQISKELEDRMLALSIKTVQVARKYNQDTVLRPILTQLVRSATSIGANYTEANNASSRLDFRNKVFIAKKEAAETRYWLQLLRAELIEEQMIDELLDEVSQFLFIFQKIVSTLKNGK